MSDSFQHWVVREVREILDRSAQMPPLLLWCDPDRSWLDLLREASKVTVLISGHRSQAGKTHTSC